VLSSLIISQFDVSFWRFFNLFPMLDSSFHLAAKSTKDDGREAPDTEGRCNVGVPMYIPAQREDESSGLSTRTLVG
jgi:hypothetical protein